MGRSSNQGYIPYPDITVAETNIVPSEAQNLFHATFDDTDFNSNLDWILQEGSRGDFLGGLDLFGVPSYSENQLSQSWLMSTPQTTIASGRYLDAGDDASQEGLDTGRTPATALAGLLTPQPQEVGYSGDPLPLKTPRLP